MTGRAFDWPAVMRACLAPASAGGLGWTPAAFWAATPREVAVALGSGGSGSAPPARGDFEALLRRYPDAGKGQGDG